jgi:hypothetical protein
LKQQETFDIQTMFDPKSIDEADFWFIEGEKLEHTSSLEELTDVSSQKKMKAETNLTQQVYTF